MCKYSSLNAGQLPPQHLPSLENLLNFIITKYLKQACGLSITGDIKIYQSKNNDVTNPDKKSDNSSSSVS